MSFKLECRVVQGRPSSSRVISGKSKTFKQAGVRSRVIRNKSKMNVNFFETVKLFKSKSRLRQRWQVKIECLDKPSLVLFKKSPIQVTIHLGQV